MICAACGEDAPTAPCAACGADPLLDGRYRLDGVLGQGSAGTTFRAVRIADERVVAIKEMPLRRGDTGKAQEMFAREARVLRQLHHPQIPQYVDDLVAGRGRHAALYLVQELIEGVDLAREMEGRRYDEGEVLDIVEALLPVLAYLHTRSPPVIHRDVKPRNVIRRPDGTLVLLDFGAVRDALADPELGGSTVAGTLGYMAPEQFRGDAEPASDIYGLGALAVALLTRRDPNTLTDASGVLVWAPHARPSLPVARLLGRMLARDPADRPGDAAALAAEIRRMRTSPTRAVDEPPSRGAARPAVPERSPAGPVAAPEPERWGPRLPEAPRAPHAERLEILEPAPPFQPPVVEELAAFAARRARERRDANDRARGRLARPGARGRGGPPTTGPAGRSSSSSASSSWGPWWWACRSSTPRSGRHPHPSRCPSPFPPRSARRRPRATWRPAPLSPTSPTAPRVTNSWALPRMAVGWRWRSRGRVIAAAR
jgi:serine/threonine protein kinase